MPGHERSGQVGAGSRQLAGPDEVVGRSGGDGVGEGESKLVEELRVWRNEVESDRVCPVVGDDPAREIAVAGNLLACPRACDAGVQGGRAAQLVEAEDPLDRAPEIFRPHQRPRGVPDAGGEGGGGGGGGMGWGGRWGAGGGGAGERPGRGGGRGGPPPRR